MKNYSNNKEYLNLVNDILNSNDFCKLKEYKHHGDNRMNHSIRVSYYSYLLSKKLKLNKKSVARAGLLHDYFFINNQELDFKTRTKVLFEHPKIALENANKKYDLSDLEKNIIHSHMFPIGKTLPKYKESWIVNLVDDYMSIYERINQQLNHLKVVGDIMIKIMNLKDYFDFNEEEKERFIKLFNTISKEDNYYTKSNISRYNILRKQLTINSILQTIMDNVNSKNDIMKINPFNRVEIGKVVNDVDKLNTELLEKGIDVDGLDLKGLTLDEIRMILYNSVGIKTKSLADLYDYEMNECNRITNFNYADLIVQGINPDSVLHPEEKSFIDKDFLVKYGLLDKYILEGQIFGTEILNNNKKIK